MSGAGPLCGEKHGRSLLVTVNGKGSTSPSAQARGRRPGRRPTTTRQREPHKVHDTPNRSVTTTSPTPTPTASQPPCRTHPHTRPPQTLPSTGMRHQWHRHCKIYGFGFTPGSLERGWGSGTSTAPQRRGEVPRGRPRRHGRGPTKGFPGPDLYHQHHAFTSTGGNTSTKI
jgi:hypothetical protein